MTLENIDEPQTTPIPQRELTAHQAIDDHAIVEQPTPGEQPRGGTFNKMLEDFKAGVSEATTKSGSSASPKVEPKAKEPVPALAASEDDTPDELETITSAKAADWKKLKGILKDKSIKLDEATRQLKAQQQEMLALKNGSVPQADELKAIAAERDAALKQLEQIDLERSPAFAKHYNEKFSQAVARGKSFLPAGEAERFEALVALAPSKVRTAALDEIRSKLSGIAQGQFDVALAGYEQARDERQATLNDSKAGLARAQQLRAEEGNRQAQLVTAEREAAVNKALEVAARFESFQPRADDPEHSRLAEQNQQTVAAFIRGQLKAEDAFAITIAAAEGRRAMTQIIPRLEKENAELREALASQKNATVRVSGGTRGKAPEQRKSFTESVMSELAGIQGHQ